MDDAAALTENGELSGGVGSSAEQALEAGREANGFERALDGTLYWTLSLYLNPALVAERAGRKPDAQGRLIPISASEFRQWQLKHPWSFALRNAIDPLFNDIADRERLGEVQDFLFAPEPEPKAPVDEGDGRPVPKLTKAARELRRDKIVLHFKLPQDFSWTTEGDTFTCHPPESERGVREVGLRRFWFAHSNGALSYHLSFSYRYWPRDVEGSAQPGKGSSSSRPSLGTYYFLSLLQKLAVPKEFTLCERRLEKYADDQKNAATVFDEELGIDPLDKMTVKRESDSADSEGERFWPFVKRQFGRDAKGLFGVFGFPTCQDDSALLDKTLVELVEVPGLKIPRSRSLFHVHDSRLFARLLPRGPNGEALPRKRMVQDRCYEPYRCALEVARDDATRTVHIGADPKRAEQTHVRWDWLEERTDYDALAKRGAFTVSAEPGDTVDKPEELEGAMRRGCWQVKDFGRPGNTVEQNVQLALEGFAIGPRKRADEVPLFDLPKPIEHQIPAFGARRSDCLEYLFLAGFNQNIIDWLNQDTSEVLDSTDPIYPTDDTQFDEAFFVRFANHRAMISYVPRSRSLEVGNDYIGTCPYAFLIHVLALHNEFLARDHERVTDLQIQNLSRELHQRTQSFKTLESDINRLKEDTYERFERHRYANVFRYDTEQTVFSKLQRLRGVTRRGNALREAIATLEDKSRDLEARRQAWFSTLLGFIGASSVVGLLFNIATFLAERHGVGLPSSGESLGEYYFGNAAMLLLPAIALGALGWWGGKVFWVFICSTLTNGSSRPGREQPRSRRP